MATDFFARREQALSNTVWLVVLYGLGILAGLLTIWAALAGLLYLFRFLWGLEDILFTRGTLWDPKVMLFAGIVTLAVMLGGVIHKFRQLKNGGRSVAAMLGAVPVFEDAPHSWTVLANVVEETAIAANIPTPKPYVLADEYSINALAAGHTPFDAAIIVTRGLVDNLNRDELQGVVAHETSHILNGDMRLNTRLMAFLHGLMLFYFMGCAMTASLVSEQDSAPGLSMSDREGVSAIAIVGVVLMAAGGLGAFFGSWIKAAVCREREKLADAEAVRYTRNPKGLAGALKIIGGLPFQGRLRNPQAAQVSHMVLAKGHAPLFGDFFATHPPLDDRIRWIEPDWDGDYPAPVDAWKQMSRMGQGLGG
ncbi:MAG: hypothetical protein D6E12_13615 [Desulfovibrio sp.]|nr:MAG: hypothetical protein D6E12_13615 [Desulfovibrio sp.]